MLQTAQIRHKSNRAKKHPQRDKGEGPSSRCLTSSELFPTGAGTCIIYSPSLCPCGSSLISPAVRFAGTGASAEAPLTDSVVFAAWQRGPRLALPPAVPRWGPRRLVGPYLCSGCARGALASCAVAGVAPGALCPLVLPLRKPLEQAGHVPAALREHSACCAVPGRAQEVSLARRGDSHVPSATGRHALARDAEPRHRPSLQRERER